MLRIIVHHFHALLGHLIRCTRWGCRRGYFAKRLMGKAFILAYSNPLVSPIRLGSFGDWLGPTVYREFHFRLSSSHL
jgi:hypothetical protein